MAKDRRTDRTADKADKIGAEGEQDPSQWGLVGEVELAEYQASGGAVEEEIVPLDCRTDCRCDDCFTQLRTMFGFR